MTPELPRREVLAAGAAVAAAGLAGCSAEKPSSTNRTPIPASAARTVGKADVPVGGGVLTADGKFVVTQPTAGTFRAFSSACTHEGCPVRNVSKDGIYCACHGSYFAVDDGRATKGPATKPLPSATITADGDDLTVS